MDLKVIGGRLRRYWPAIPEKLKYRIEEPDPGFFAKAVPELGWAGISNGRLLEKAKEEFDIFITGDRNLSSQRSIETSKIQVVVLFSRG